MTRRTMDVVEAPMSGWKLLRPAPHLCQECAANHPPELPHNRDSIFYQIKFALEHDNRGPTWEDACAHCEPDLRKAWLETVEKVMQERAAKAAAVP